MEEKLLGVRDTARRLNVSRDTVYEMLHSGSLAGIRVGDGQKVWRVRPREIERYLLKREAESAARNGS